MPVEFLSPYEKYSRAAASSLEECKYLICRPWCLRSLSVRCDYGKSLDRSSPHISRSSDIYFLQN